MPKRNTKEKIIIFFDGHVSHLTLQLSELAQKNNVELVCLFPSTTQILQPLDVAFFKAMKSYWKKKHTFCKFVHKIWIQKYHVPIIIQQIINDQKNNFEKSLRNGFRA